MEQTLTYYKQTDTQVSTTLAGESVILNHQKGTYYNLNEVGSMVWQCLSLGKKSLDELVLEITSKFEIEEETSKKDILELLEDLKNENLVEETV